MLIKIVLFVFYSFFLSNILIFAQSSDIDKNSSVVYHLDLIEIPAINRLKEKSVYADIINHSEKNPYSGQSRSTNAHETAHFIHNVLMNAHTISTKKPMNGFYVLNGKAAVIEEPKMKRSFVKNFVPLKLRSYRWKTYFEKSDWEDRPLYILDEWSAYIIGGKVCVDDIKNNRHDGKYTDGVSGCLDFTIYSLSLCIAVKKFDPDYWHNNEQFKAFIIFQLIESNKIFLAGRGEELLKSEKQDNLLRNLLDSEEAQPHRDFLNEEFNGLWLDEKTRTSVMTDIIYQSFQK